MFSHVDPSRVLFMKEGFEKDWEYKNWIILTHNLLPPLIWNNCLIVIGLFSFLKEEEILEVRTSREDFKTCLFMIMVIIWMYEPQESCREKTPPMSHEVVCSRPENLILRSQNQIHGKLLLSQKLCNFRGSRFSQFLILSTSPFFRYQVRFYANIYFE